MSPKWSVYMHSHPYNIIVRINACPPPRAQPDPQITSLRHHIIHKHYMWCTQPVIHLSSSKSVNVQFESILIQVVVGKLRIMMIGMLLNLTRKPRHFTWLESIKGEWTLLAGFMAWLTDATVVGNNLALNYIFRIEVVCWLKKCLRISWMQILGDFLIFSSIGNIECDAPIDDAGQMRRRRRSRSLSTGLNKFMTAFLGEIL